MRDPPKRQSCNQINRKILKSNYIPPCIKSNEGLAAIHVDVYGIVPTISLLLEQTIQTINGNGVYYKKNGGVVTN